MWTNPRSFVEKAEIGQLSALEAAEADTTPSLDLNKLPKNPDELPKYFPELKGADKETIKKAYDAMNQVATGTPAEKLKGLSDLATQFPDTLGAVVEKLGVKDQALTKLATNKDALAALSTLTDPAKGKADKAQAALQLAKATGDAFKPEDLKGVLKTALGPFGYAKRSRLTESYLSDPGVRDAVFPPSRPGTSSDATANADALS